MKRLANICLIAGFIVSVWFAVHTEPGPTPDVVPPPVVVVDEKPLIDADGLHVLIVEEKDDRRNLPIKQMSVLAPSSQITGWFADHQAQWRIFDTNDEDLTHEDEKWPSALRDMKRESLPWIYIQAERKQKFSGPLPGSVEDTIALLQQHAPAGSPE